MSSNVITEQPLIEEMAGGDWSVVDTPHAIGTLGGVACPTADYCISVGTVFVSGLGAGVGPVITAERAHGAWTLNQQPGLGGNVDAFGSVACPTASRCIGVGDQLLPAGYPEPRATYIAEHTDRGWSVDATPNV